MITALTLLMLAQADGGVLVANIGEPIDAGPRVEDLYIKCGDAPEMEIAGDGGYYLVPLRRQQRNNCKLAACENFANATMQQLPQTSSSVGVMAVVVGAVVLFGGGIVLGYMIPHLGTK